MTDLSSSDRGWAVLRVAPARLDPAQRSWLCSWRAPGSRAGPVNRGPHLQGWSSVGGDAPDGTCGAEGHGKPLGRWWGNSAREALLPGRTLLGDALDHL